MFAVWLRAWVEEKVMIRRLVGSRRVSHIACVYDCTSCCVYMEWMSLEQRTVRVGMPTPAEPPDKPTQPTPGKPETIHQPPPHPNAAPGPQPPGSGLPRAAVPVPSTRPPSRARSWPGSRDARATHRFLAKGAHQLLRSRACARGCRAGSSGRAGECRR